MEYSKFWEDVNDLRRTFCICWTHLGDSTANSSFTALKEFEISVFSSFNLLKLFGRLKFER
jgi:hypothetical protein